MNSGFRRQDFAGRRFLAEPPLSDDERSRVLQLIDSRTTGPMPRLPWFDDLDVEFGTLDAHRAIEVVLLASDQIDPPTAVALGRRLGGEQVSMSEQVRMEDDPDPDLAIATLLVTLYRDAMSVAAGYHADASGWERRIDRPLLLSATDLLVREAARLRRSTTREQAPAQLANDPTVVALLRELDEAWRQLLVLRDDVLAGILLLDPHSNQDMEFHRQRLTLVLGELRPICDAAGRRDRLIDRVGSSLQSRPGWLQQSLLATALRREVRRMQEVRSPRAPT